MRVARQIHPGVHYHLIWRFVDRTWFLTDDEERSVYRRLLGRAVGPSDWRCTAFALMSNHIHIAAIAGRQTLASWSKRVNSPFAYWMNRRHDRIGPVMADRPASYAIKSEREAHLIAYIHNNPVRAGVVACPIESSWTSHRYYVRGNAPGWLHVAHTMERLGFASADELDGWIQRTPGDSGKVPTRDVRAAARKRGAIEIATPGNDVVPLVTRDFAFLRPDPALIVRAAAESLQLTPGQLCSRRRSSSIVAARAIAVNAAEMVGITSGDIATALALSPAAVTAIRRREQTSTVRAGLRTCLARLQIELGGK